ncbi:MAG TPA: hypothetical protein VFE03_08850 [Caulobacteraceae bacterium]|jgi:hypothetical protein|nr:hypothetical protein [Caulobacteraceae bacterium]
MPVLPPTANAAATAALAAHAERQNPSAQARAASADDAKNFGALVASFAKAQNVGKTGEG